jgi:RNA polymerase sigma factor (sigma-70 family)
MTDDSELLRRYAKDRSEEAFAELVGRHLNLVYAAALRLVGGDAHRAQDVAQQVFTALARQAAPLSHHASLTGWLYTCTRYTAAKAVRTEQRRQKHEWEAQSMHDLLEATAPEASWDRLRPVLDDVMGELDARDREAVLLRFFESRPFVDIGAALRLTEDAARMRVDRALERMRRRLARRGFTSTSVALAAILTNQAVAAAPSGLQRTVAGAALAGAAAGAGPASLTTAINVLKSYLVIGSALALTGVTGIVLQHEMGTRLSGAPATSAALELRPMTVAIDGETGEGRRIFDPSMLDQQPVPTYRPRPLYPYDMKRQGLSGQVVVRFIVNAQGTVEDPVAVHSTRSEFEASTLQAVSHWRFKPGRRGDRAVDTRLQVPIVFSVNAEN